VSRGCAAIDIACIVVREQAPSHSTATVTYLAIRTVGEILASIVHILFTWPPALRILGWVLAGVVVLCGLLIIRYHVRLWWEVRTRGWTAEHHGRDRIVYRELVGGRLEDLEIDGEMLGGTPHHVIFVPSEEKWERTSPAWARGRRAEIFSRLRSRFRAPGYEFAGP
jgi:hypothetical protein